MNDLCFSAVYVCVSDRHTSWLTCEYLAGLPMVAESAAIAKEHQQLSQAFPFILFFESAAAIVHEHQQLSHMYIYSHAHNRTRYRGFV